MIAEEERQENGILSRHHVPLESRATACLCSENGDPQSTSTACFGVNRDY